MLGYELGENKQWVIVPEQAEIIRYIFDRFVKGQTANKIAQELNQMEKFTVNGKKWSASSILIVLRNEKYVGDIEMQKTITKDFLTHRSSINKGEAPRYYVKNHHVGIIDRVTWDKVQTMLFEKPRADMTKGPGKKKVKSIKGSPFGNLRCGAILENGPDAGKPCGEGFFRTTYTGVANGYSDERSLKATGEDQDEAQTVKVIYYLYLNGFSFTEIAELLTDYGRKTKLGNTEWNPGTLAGVIANERHCGDVLARKTFTPNFLTHKSKKNNNDRTQYRQRDHHEAIVSREVYNAANHLRASRSYTKKNRPLPVLSVVDDGILRGYVPFDKDWTGFSAEEYREASESVMREKKQDTVEVMNRLDLSGYEVVRAQYFATLQNPAMTISNGKLRFNTACLKKFEDVEYVELLLNSVDRCIAIRPCEKDNPNAIRWGRLKEGRWCASTLGCRGLAKALFDMMEWEEGLKYRFRGQLVGQDDDKLMLFELDEPEMVKVEEIVLPSKEQDEEGKTVKQTIYIFPPEWAGTFGKPITSIAQVGILQQEHYSGNWDVLRPAAEIEEMNTFTADGLNALLHEAEKIMEGWTDTDE